jgi:hypothetical protein
MWQILFVIPAAALTADVAAKTEIFWFNNSSFCCLPLFGKNRNYCAWI